MFLVWAYYKVNEQFFYQNFLVKDIEKNGLVKYLSDKEKQDIFIIKSIFISSKISKDDVDLLNEAMYFSEYNGLL